MEDSLDVDMEMKDFVNVPASSNPGGVTENNSLYNSSSELNVVTEIKEDESIGEVLERNEDGGGNADGQPFLGSKFEHVEGTTVTQVSVERNGTVIVTEGTNNISPTVQVENGTAVQDGTPLRGCKRDGSFIRSHDDDVSGAKRPRITLDELQASVHVTYNSLTRDSKRKLEELLQKWSEWHSRHYSSSPDSKDELESGERTYFPALHVGAEKSSAVSFWIDGETRNLQSKEIVELDNNTIPLYDRGYSFGLTTTDALSNLDSRNLEIGDTPRCFNCGSYNHSLKECPKPRDNAAVNSARKQLKTRRSQNGISRNPTRYYQDTPGGKFDGLRPGVLDVETRRLLGLGELDPPPWLNRMREIGYPPGYLDPEVEDLPSGITIFGDEEEKKIIRGETEDGEILDTDNLEQPSLPEPTRKMSVEFPGINSPIPEMADERRWSAGPSNFGPSRNNRPHHHRHIHSSEPISKPNYHDQRWNREDGPPGVDLGSSSSSYSPRYGDYESRSPNYGRFLSDRGRRSPLFQETSSHHDYNNRPENVGNDRWGGFSPPGTGGSSYNRKDMHEEHHRSGRRY